MKYAICSTKLEAELLQLEDDEALHLPWGARYVSGANAPEHQGETQHAYAITERPDGLAWAYPIADDRVVEYQTVEALGPEWFEE